MRKLVLDFLDYVQTGRRLPHCALCDSRYNDAKPFIEGSTGALVCAGCIRRHTPTDGIEPSMYFEAHRMLHPPDDGNPYRPPSIDSETVPCLLCDEPTSSLVNSRGKLSGTICSPCLDHSSPLLKDNAIG